ncbi:MAG TPA: prolyl oligopeptidase family serine peptidase [Terracidiphilus sp.]|jgi:prolyl oligopeptidase|nr:prolyl oligopeptidase family serine peptidase [Terracidiphilus sp.]
MRAELDCSQGVVETIHGYSIADPYRWLEDPTSVETRHWIDQQRLRFEGYLRQLGSLSTLRRRVTEFTDVETIDQIGKVQGRYFYRKRGVGQEQASIFVMDSSDHSGRLLVDPTGQGPFVAIGIHAISPDATLLAYEVKQGGEHTKAMHFVDVNTGVVLPDHLGRGLARGLILRNANDGFYYCHELSNDPAAAERDHIVRFHRRGSSMYDDPALLTVPRTRWSKLVLTHNDEMLGAIHCHEQSGVSMIDFYCSRQDRDGIWKCICRNEPAPFGPFFYRGRLFAHRFQDTPNGEIIELDVTNGRPIGVIVPAWHVRTKQCAVVQNLLYISYLVGTETVVRIWSFDGDFLGMLPLNDGYTWGLVPGYTSEVDELFLHAESFVRPPMLLRYQPQTGERIVWNQRLAPNLATNYFTRNLTYTSKDGTDISMSLVGPKDDALLQDRPTIMTAYGGFGITMTPQYSTFVSLLLELGFLFALPQIRGGGERGKSWHEAARGRNRQVAFDDFIAAANFLRSEGFTNPQKLAIFGGSNSGILVGAAITQRPDLFRAALCIAPLLDMVRYHLFDRAQVWADEYGTADDPDDLRALLAYSPYHHVHETTNYPAVLFVCGDKDTRCNPAHARKMAARLINRSAQERQILLDHSAERGHSPTMPLSVRVDGLTHRIAFLCHELGVPIPKENQDDETCR